MPCTARGHAWLQQQRHLRRQLRALLLLECLQQPQLRSEAASALMQGVARGELGDAEVGLLVVALVVSAGSLCCAQRPPQP